jgi:arylsulfatase A-like enzyme
VTVYRSVPLVPGTVGAAVSAADIDMDVKTGTVTVVEPGWKGAKAWKYAADSYMTKTDTFAAHMEEKTAVKIEHAPNGGPCRFMRFENAVGAQVAALQMEEDGRLTLIRTSDSETTTGTYVDVWIPRTMDLNQDAGECVIRLYDRLESRTESLRIPIGAQAIVEFQEGILDAGTGMELIVAETELGTDPLYVPLDRPNIVLIDFDDAPAQSYMQHMSAVSEMIADGALLSKHFVATPLCAPSRANMITGQYGQNNGVFGNGGATDDWIAAGRERYSWYARMSDLSYRTCHAGKFLHGYDPEGNDADHTDGWLPMGCNWGFVSSDAYQQFDYVATDNRDGDWTIVDTTGGDVHDPPEDHYFGRKIAAFAEDFIDDHYSRYPGLPFAMFLAPYAGHNNTGGTDPEDPGGPAYPPDPSDRKDTANRPAGWAAAEFPATGDLGDNPPADGQDYQWPEQSTNWNTKPSPLPGWMNSSTMDAGDLQDNEDDYFDVVRQMQSVNDMIIAIKAQLQSYGALNDTVFMITSDNGYNRGEHALRGKGDFYDQAVRLPLVVEGPGVAAGQVVETLTQNIDFLPTCLEIAGVLPDENGVTADDVDGFSWWGQVSTTGVAPAVTRQTAFCRYESGNVGSWEEALGSDEPPDWYAVIGPNQRYVTYDPENAAPPEANRGEAYVTSTDPGMIDNLYPSLPQYKAWPISSLMQVILTTSGAPNREAQLQSFSLGIGEAPIMEGPRLVVDGGVDGTAWIDLSDSLGRWYCRTGTTFSTVPAPVIADFGSMGDGALYSDDPYDPTTAIGSGFGRIELGVRDRDHLGASGGSQQLAINTSAVISPFVRRGRFWLGERPAPGLPVAWKKRARRISTITQDAPANSTTVRFVDIAYEAVDGYAVTPIDYTWTVDPWIGSNPGDRHVYTLAGSQAPVCPLVRVAGPLTRIDATDSTTGLGMQWNGTTFDRGSLNFGLMVDEWLLIDTKTWVARLKDTDDWDLTTGTDVSIYLDWLDQADPSGALWRLQPAPYLGNPDDMRVYVYVAGFDRDDTTALQIRAPKTRYA